MGAKVAPFSISLRTEFMVSNFLHFPLILRSHSHLHWFRGDSSGVVFKEYQDELDPGSFSPSLRLLGLGSPRRMSPRLWCCLSVYSTNFTSAAAVLVQSFCARKSHLINEFPFFTGTQSCLCLLNGKKYIHFTDVTPPALMLPFYHLLCSAWQVVPAPELGESFALYRWTTFCATWDIFTNSLRNGLLLHRSCGFMSIIWFYYSQSLGMFAN